MRKIKIFTNDLDDGLLKIEEDVNIFIKNNQLQIYDLHPTQSSVVDDHYAITHSYTILLDYQVP